MSTNKNHNKNNHDKTTAKQSNVKKKAIMIDVAHDTVKTYKNQSKSDISKAIKDGTLTKCNAEETILQAPYNDFYHQLKVADQDVPITWVVCGSEKDCVLKLTTKKGTSVTTSSLKKHPCYAQWRDGSQPKKLQQLTSSERKESNHMIKEAAVDCIIDDMRPIRFTEGDGVTHLIKKSIEVCVKLERMPTEEEIQRIIPGRNANKTQLMRRRDRYKAELIQSLKILDDEILPPIHLQFDFWEDKPHRKHYLGVMAVEPNWRTKGLDNYVLEFIEWEQLVAEDFKGSFL